MMAKGENGGRRTATLALIGFLLAGFGLGTRARQSDNADPLRQLRYRYVGPVGNRVISVVGVPGDPRIYYVGAASGGIFKTTDGGTHWTPIFDGQAASSVGSLAIAPSDHNVIWAGTGETFIRSNISIGDGVYRSTDAGETWTRVGLEKTGRIGRIVVDPRNPDVALVAALGHSYGPQQERGVFRTADGGKTWERVLFVDENTGCSDLVMDPNNPRILFAGMWQLVLHTWGRESGGPGSGLYTSRDGGKTWTRLSGHGLPDGPMGKIGLAMAPSDSKRIYALIETADGGLWRSDDGGTNWRLINQDHALSQRWHYYTRLAVAPDDPNEIYVMAVQMSLSIDGGATIRRLAGGGDNHDVWIDPSDARRITVGHDGGVILSMNRGQSWMRPLLPVAQIYHVYTDNQVPYNVYGNRQDGPSIMGPSNTRLPSGRIPSSAWRTVGGCESGFAIPDPADANIVWGGCYDGRLDRYDARTRQSRSVSVWPDTAIGWPAADLKYRFNWTFPIAISPHDHNTVYVGSQHVHRTTDGGQTWTEISPDLTGNDKTKQRGSGGLTPDNISVEYFPVVFAIAESPREKGVIWAGTNDGLVQVTRDGGANWTNVARAIPGLPPLGTVQNIEPSRYQNGAAYVAIDLHQVNNRDPFVYKTTDYGKTWKSISSDIPHSVFSYAHCIREDPVREGLLYLGTENALYVSFNDGANWVPLQNNLPHAPIYWLTIQESFNDLVVATYGRGFWILDDLTPLQNFTAQARDTSAVLFPLHQAYRWRYVADDAPQPDDGAAGTNPKLGADINYYLKSPAAGPVTITIANEQGRTVRTLRGSPESGVNRVWWDLRYETPPEPILRTSPPGHPHVTAAAGEDARPYIAWQMSHARAMGAALGHLVSPGTYSVTLSVGGRDLTQKLVVKKDPTSLGTDADIAAQDKLLSQIRQDTAAVAAMITESESIRAQIGDRMKLITRRSGADAVPSMMGELDRKLLAFEDQLFQMTSADFQDAFRSPRRLYEKLLNLAFDVGSDSADYAPTAQHVQVADLYHRQLVAAQADFKALLDKDLSSLNDVLRERKIPNVVGQRP